LEGVFHDTAAKENQSTIIDSPPGKQRKNGRGGVDDGLKEKKKTQKPS